MTNNALLKLVANNWTPNEPGLSQADISELETFLPSSFPSDLADLYRIGDGAHITSDIYLADSDDVQYFNQDEIWREAFPSAIFFGFDERSGIFFVDTSSQLSCISGGIYWCDRSSMNPTTCLSYGKNLEEFLENIFSGRDPRRTL